MRNLQGETNQHAIPCTQRSLTEGIFHTIYCQGASEDVCMATVYMAEGRPEEVQPASSHEQQANQELETQ